MRARTCSNLGRLLAPDPAGLAAASPADPQSFNAYAYVENRPAVMYDPLGLQESGGFSPFWGILGNLFGGLSSLFGGGTPVPSTSIAGQQTPGYVWNGGFGEANGIPLGMNVPGPLSANAGGYCDFGPCGSLGFAGPGWSAQARGWLKGLRAYILSHPWEVSWIVPVYGLPGLGGVGPAGSFYLNPQTGVYCGSIGIGASAGRNISVGPITTAWTIQGATVDDTMSGGSISAGLNVPLLGPIGPGLAGAVGASGLSGGPTVGMMGFSISATDAICGKF